MTDTGVIYHKPYYYYYYYYYYYEDDDNDDQYYYYSHYFGVREREELVNDNVDDVENGVVLLLFTLIVSKVLLVRINLFLSVLAALALLY